mmetsp:Transcript_40200/g.40831  ORF Transcript_40200/g.40831 Transcript_40200/m.40831 type:complete len:82 (-) Transcript_40200:214-459(-)
MDNIDLVRIGSLLSHRFFEREVPIFLFSFSPIIVAYRLKNIQINRGKIKMIQKQENAVFSFDLFKKILKLRRLFQKSYQLR